MIQASAPGVTQDRTIAIVGAGHAGGELAVALRQEGFGGRIVMIGEEAHPPYQRPPLSKAYLGGACGLEGLYLRPLAAYATAAIEWIGNARVASVARAQRRLHLADGRTMHYDGLALATGGRARRLDLGEPERTARAGNVHYVRTIDDIERMRKRFTPGARIVIIGAGYVGLEVAAVAVQHGLHTTVIESAERVLARVSAPEVSGFYAGVHRDAGVDLRTGIDVADLEYAATGEVSHVVCRDGARLAADLVVVGIGLLPNVELAQEAGLAVDNGIVVDEYGRTSDPLIVAAGDCSNHPSAFLGRRVRLESVPNAVEQARVAAATLTGKPRPYNSVPWFWSDQYDLKLQTVGMCQGYDQCVIRGAMAARSFTAFYLRNGRLIAADAVNRVQDFMMAKRLVLACSRPSPEQLADDTVPLKTMLPMATA